MPDININSFINNFSDGARAYMFYAYISSPVGGNSDSDAYLVSATTLPASTIDPIEVAWQGMTYKPASTQTFDDWTVTFRVDINANIRDKMENWKNVVHNAQTNAHGNPQTYMVDQRVQMLNPQTRSPSIEYTLVKAWPSSVGEVSLDHTSKEIATFDVTFTYVYHTTQAAGTNLGGLF